MRRLLASAMLCLWAAGAIGQERPPESPHDAEWAVAPDSVRTSGRPPRKPDRPASAVPADAHAPLSEPKTDAEPVREAFGPPPPPRWWALRESDQDYAACRLALSLLGAAYTEETPATDAGNRDCGIARPVRVSRILPGLALEGGALMRCDTARALAFWARDFLRPAAATLPGAPQVTGLRLGTSYECRNRVGTGGDTPQLSEHALGNAIDISAILLDGADPIPVAPRANSGDRVEAFQRAIRGAACLFFTTVLGPGANAAHENHLHLDLAARRGGWRLCQ